MGSSERLLREEEPLLLLLLLLQESWLCSDSLFSIFKYSVEVGGCQGGLLLLGTTRLQVVVL